MMRTNSKYDNIHKAWMYRALKAIASDPYLASVLYFKGGTCASMLGWLDRFSVDLDFDYGGKLEDIPKTRDSLEIIFADLGLSIKDKSKNGIQYFLKYANYKEGENIARNTLKIDAAFPFFISSKYAPQRLLEIDSVFICQTRETMFSHKLCALMDRFQKTGHLAGRDLYDIHYFFMNGYNYDSAIIAERTNLSLPNFFAELISFIEKNVTEQVITEDLSALLEPQKFKVLRKTLKREVIQLLKEQ
mgnify:FL=1